MIKINLATRKQSTTLADHKGTSTLAIPSMEVVLEYWQEIQQELPVKKYLVAIVIMVAASWYAERYDEEKMVEVNAAFAKVASEKSRLEVQAGQMGLEEERKNLLETDELTIRTKIDVLQRLVSERSAAPKYLLTLATATPKEVWLSEFKIEKDELFIKGYALDFSQISDFMKSLNGSTLFKDVTLKSSKQERDNEGVDIAYFELEAKQR